MGIPIGEQIIGKFVTSFWDGQITGWDELSKTYTIIWSDGDTSHGTVPYQYVAKNVIPDESQLGIGVLVLDYNGNWTEKYGRIESIRVENGVKLYKGRNFEAPASRL